MKRRQGERNMIQRRAKAADRLGAGHHPTARKHKVGDCGRAQCHTCHSDKLLGKATPQEKRAPSVADWRDE